MPENEIPKNLGEGLGEMNPETDEHKQGLELEPSHETNELMGDLGGADQSGDKTEWTPPSDAKLVMRTPLEGSEVVNVPETPMTEEEKSKALETLMEHGIPIQNLHESYEDMLDESQK